MQNYKKIPTYASIWGIILHFSSFCNGNLQFPIFNLHFPISNASMFLDASVLLLAGKFLVYVPKLNSGSEYSEQLRSPHSKRYFSLLWGPHYFFRTPWYSSMVFVEIVVVVLEVSFC